MDLGPKLHGTGPIQTYLDLLSTGERGREAADHWRAEKIKPMLAKVPDGRRNTVELRVASIPALLVMKGYALVGRDKHQDAYDIYFSVREFEGVAEALAQASRPLLGDPVALKGFQHIAGKFTDDTAFGPVTVRRFLTDSAALGAMTADQVQVDAFHQVRAWLDRLDL